MADPKMMFEGLAVALVTPYRNGLVDLVALARLTNHVVEGGTRALYPCGCTGEATSLTREEREQVIRTVIEAARGRASGLTVLQLARSLVPNSGLTRCEPILSARPYCKTI